MGTVFKMTPDGNLTTLAGFEGANPRALVQASDGNFYGTTEAGGTSKNCNGGCGTVFKITPSGTLTTLYSFCSLANCADGWNPWAGVIQATDGNFYGTTELGGANCAPLGCGTIFRMTPGGSLTTLYSFCSQANCADGAVPYAGLIQASDGNF
jgi:uncharacterized repeat protein (TIGR03803 family)